MSRDALAVLLLAFALAGAGRAAPDGPPAPPGEDVAHLRFGWPAPARARVTHRRTLMRTGEAPRVFTARYELVVDRAGEELRLGTRRTSWRGALPVPRAASGQAIRAAEAVVQRIGPEGEFLGLEGVDALRPVLERVLGEADVRPEQAERAVPQALASLRADAEELWNLAVGFWIGADLRLGEAYAMRSEAELPLLPGVRAAHSVEFRLRRRVPCAGGERPFRCVEAVLRAVPDRAAVEGARKALLPRLLAEAAPSAPGALAAESELVLVTDPETLLPRKLVWTRAARLGAPDGGPAAAERVDRAEYEYRWLTPARAPARPAPGRAGASRGERTSEGAGPDAAAAAGGSRAAAAGADDAEPHQPRHAP